jgi:hypothetical protein
VKWFGKDWSAPVCSYAEHVATPVGETCLRCSKAILPGDAGFMIPSLTDATSAVFGPVKAWHDVPFHRACFLESVLGPEKALEIEQGEEI